MGFEIALPPAPPLPPLCAKWSVAPLSKSHAALEDSADARTKLRNITFSPASFPLPAGALGASSI
jgi:hypothetical protein